MVTQVVRPRSSRILTIPNVVSVIRLACLPLFLWILFGAHSRLGAGILLAVLGSTDWVDGYIARHFDQVSDLGKVLDPTADRLLFIVGVVGIIIDGSAPLWFALAVVVREAVVGGGLAVLTLFGMKRFAVSWWGKAGTAGLLLAFPMFLAGAATHGSAKTAWLVAAWSCGVPGLLASYYSAVTYVPIVKRALREGRSERAT